MTDGLRSTFDAACERALAWRDGDDPTPVLAAVALASALEIMGGSGHGHGSLAEGRVRERLLALGARVLLAAGARREAGASSEEDAADAAALAVMLARDGVRALRGEPARDRARNDVRAPT